MALAVLHSVPKQYLGFPTFRKPQSYKRDFKVVSLCEDEKTLDPIIRFINFIKLLAIRRKSNLMLIVQLLINTLFRSVFERASYWCLLYFQLFDLQKCTFVRERNINLKIQNEN